MTGTNISTTGGQIKAGDVFLSFGRRFVAAADATVDEVTQIATVTGSGSVITIPAAQPITVRRYV